MFVLFVNNSYGNVDSKLRLCFTAFDEDKSGAIDSTEFRKMMTTTLLASRNMFQELVGAYTSPDVDFDTWS